MNSTVNITSIASKAEAERLLREALKTFPGKQKLLLLVSIDENKDPIISFASECMPSSVASGLLSEALSLLPRP